MKAGENGANTKVGEDKDRGGDQQTRPMTYRRGWPSTQGTKFLPTWETMKEGNEQGSRREISGFGHKRFGLMVFVSSSQEERLSVSPHANKIFYISGFLVFFVTQNSKQLLVMWVLFIYIFTIKRLKLRHF